MNPGKKLAISFLSALVSEHPFAFETISQSQWNNFKKFLEGNHLGTIIYQYLKDSKHAVPDDIIAMARKSYEDTLIFQTYYRQVLQNIIASIKQPIALMQGIALQEVIYSAELLRPMNDIDLYIVEGSLDEVRDVFIKKGFTPYLTYRNVLEYGELHIDLHEDFWGEARIPARRKIIPQRQLYFRDSHTIPGFLIPENQHLYNHAILHAHKHAFSKLTWCFDLLLLDKKCSTEETVTPEEEYLRKRTGVLLGDIGFKGFHAHKSNVLSLRQWVQHFAVHAGDIPGSGEILLAFSMPRWIDTLTYLGETIIPPDHILKDMYGLKSKPLLLLHRLGALLKIFFRFFTGTQAGK